MHPSIKCPLCLALSMILCALFLAGCGKSKEEKEAEARRAQYQKMYQEYQRRLKETNDRFK